MSGPQISMTVANIELDNITNLCGTSEIKQAAADGISHFHCFGMTASGARLHCV